ncbi:DUF3857 domain-containing protein [Puia dinghuensis]|uniref:DUF3857 domain-containing protein n=1 Tax=Puia dinghuensis TaxID=1792502 RepID=A0A8J2XPN3_9BACT|nr:DUF3857 domain-containing protein [Puia dinghuensis]GGA81285.1 hypothetical protein GCM10011511_00300 [Puia dinghuensis]
MSRFTRIIDLLLIGTLLCPAAKAQSVAEIRQKYPDEQAVMLEHSLHYTITVKDGKPQVKSDEVQRLLYISAQAGAFLSKYSFSHSGFHQLQQFSAFTLTADSKKIKVTDFKTTDSKSNSIFYDDVKETSFDFPAVAPGAIGTLETSTLDKDPSLLSPFFISGPIPVINTELKITFPKGMTIRYLLKGLDTARIGVTKEERHGETILSFKATDMAADKHYEDAPGLRWYDTHILFYIYSYTDETGRVIDYLSRPDDLYHLYRSYLKDINKEAGPALRSIVDSLCQNTATATEKTEKIYRWVQENIKYIAFEQGMEGFVPRDANLVCSRRFGDCKDMSSILTLMLRTAGIPAYYTWIGTRTLPYKYTETPTPIVDNHMICCVRLDDRYLFLDGTDPFCIFGWPSQGIQDKQALVAIDDSTFKIMTVPVPAAEESQLTDSTILNLQDKTLKGTIAVNLTGYYSEDQQATLSYTDQKGWQEEMRSYFSRGSNKFRLDTFSVGNRSDKAHLRLTAGFTLEDYVRNIGNECYLNMNLLKHYLHMEIDYPKRRSPIEFPFLSRRRYVVVLNIPAGYEVSYLPQSKNYHNAVWGFNLSYEKKDRQVILTQEFDTGQLMLQPDQFADWNKVLEQLFPLYRETISLQKTSK